MNGIEEKYILDALRDAGNSVSRAAKLLGFKHHQSLLSLLNNRHKDLRARLNIVPLKRRKPLITRGSKHKSVQRGQGVSPAV